VKTRTRIIVTGRVQGVGFRASCAREAERLGVAGTVRNRAEGSVEVVAEGDEAAVDSLTDWCRVGPTFARVQSIECINEVPAGEATFRIMG
jgi:acylphosphatase